MAEEVDVVLIGMGPGGEAAAGELAEAGLSVVGIEGRLVGGECPYYKITGPRTVHAASQDFAARCAILINTGTETMIPPIPGLADVPFWTNREAIAAGDATESPGIAAAARR